MSIKLLAGIARAKINPPVGIGKIGKRLFADPIEGIESDLFLTIVIFNYLQDSVALVTCDLCGIPVSVVDELRQKISGSLNIPVPHILVNESHTHSCPAFPEYFTDSPEQNRLKEEYKEIFFKKAEETSIESKRSLQPIRIGTGFGHCPIGVYRRERNSKGEDVLGEVPNAPTDPSVGVVRVDDLDGKTLITIFSYGCHAVTMGPRSKLASSDFPGEARRIIEMTNGGIAVFLQACGGNINPIGGIGYEEDCRDTKNRVGAMLAGEVIKIAATIRTNLEYGERTKLGEIPNILFSPLVHKAENKTSVIKAVEENIKLRFVKLPDMNKANLLSEKWGNNLNDKLKQNAPQWEITVAKHYVKWTKNLMKAIKKENPTFDMPVQVIRINDFVIAAISAEVFFETGLYIKLKSPIKHTQVLGYSNGLRCYLPREKDFPKNGWDYDSKYAVPDLVFQFSQLPAAFHPESEKVVINKTLEMIKQINV